MANSDELNEEQKLYNQLINQAKAFQNIQKDTESSYQNLTDKMKDALSNTKKIREYNESINKIHWDQSNAFKAILQRSKKRFEEAKGVYKTESDIAKKQKEVGKLKQDAYNQALKAADQENEEQFQIYNTLHQQLEQQQAELQIQDAQNKALKQEIDKTGTIYKLYGKIHSSIGGVLEMLESMAASVLPMVGSLLKGIMSALQKVAKFGKEVFNTFLDIQSITGNLQADLGLTSNQFNTIREQAALVADEAFRYGMNFEEALGFTRQLSELTGKNRILLGDQVDFLASIAKSTGLGAEGAAEIYSNFRLLGKSLSSVDEEVNQIADRSSTLGLNVTKTLETTSELVKESSGLRFENGVEGIAKLVQKAQSLRVEINDLSQLADDFMKPEDAIEKAAGLRVLGGAFSDIADPMELMYKAQNAPNELAEGFLDAAKNLAVYNEELNRFEIPPKQRMRMQQAVEGIGLEFEQVKNAALQGAQNMKLMSQMSPESKKIFNDDQLKGIANMAKMTEKGEGYIQMTSGPEMKTMLKNIHKLSSDQLKSITERLDSERELSMTRQNIVEQFQNIYRRFQMAFVPMFNSLDGMLKDSGFMKQLRLGIDELQKLVENSIAPMFSEGGPAYEAMTLFGNSLRKSIEEFRHTFDPDGDVWSQLTSGFKELAINFAETSMKYIEPMFSNVIRTGISEAWEALGFDSYEPKMKEIPGMNLTDSGKERYTGFKREKVDDFIYNPKENKVVDFNKDDLIMGGTNLGSNNKVEKTEPQELNINVSGTIQVEGESNSVQLTQNDLRNIVTREFVQKVMDQMNSMKRSGGIKKTNPTPPIT